MVRKNRSKDETTESEGWVPKRGTDSTETITASEADESTLEAPTETVTVQTTVPTNVNCNDCGGPCKEVHQDLAGWSLWQCIRCKGIVVVKKPGSEFGGNFVEVADQKT